MNLIAASGDGTWDGTPCTRLCSYMRSSAPAARSNQYHDRKVVPWHGCPDCSLRAGRTPTDARQDLAAHYTDAGLMKPAGLIQAVP